MTAPETPPAAAVPPTPPTVGDVFFTDSGDRITVHRTARDGSWADVTVTQPGGASWRKRQPLRDGRFAFPVRTVEEASRDPR